MSWLRKMRVVFFVAGVALCVATLIGARQLTGGSASEGAGKTDGGRRAQGGPVVMGTVDTDPQPVWYGLPPVLQSGTVAKVFVKDHDEVKTGQPLYSFDDTMQRADLKRAQAAVESAKLKVKEAEQGTKQHEANKKVMRQTVSAAKSKVDLTTLVHNQIERNLKNYYKTERIAESEWAERLTNDTNLLKARAEYTAATNEWELAKAKLEQLELIDPLVKVREAEAAVKQAEAEQAKAQDAVDLCVVKAHAAGTVEQLTIGPGATLGIGTRTPALWLIPSGPRVVRAEVEAEFAHRVGPDLKGKSVTISDHTDTSLTYTGTVLDISNTFLLKRANAENFLNGDTRVIEVVVEVKGPVSSDNKQPLRVGQRVRVNLGQ